jgi:trimethylamine:corrinoid methyltransferase-like protein
LSSNEHLRSSDLFIPTIFNRDSRAAWESEGRKGLEEKAREKALTLLETHEVEPLPEDVQKELRSIQKKADEELTA